MSGEKNIEASKLMAQSPISDSSNRVSEKDMGKDGIPSDLISSASAPGGATYESNVAANQPSASWNSFLYPPTSSHDYNYSGYHSVFPQSHDRGYNTAAGSYTLGSDFQSAGLMNGFHPASSYSNQNPGFFMPCYPVNYQSSGRVRNNNYRYQQRENFARNIDIDTPELTRGPRAQNRNASLNKQGEDEIEQLGLAIDKDNYNLPEFQTEYESAKFYVIKSYSEDNIHKCIKYDVWSSTPNGNKKLNAAFQEADARTRETGVKCPVFLLFSVNGSGQFVGVAEMIGPVDFSKSMEFWQHDKWNGFFPIKWHIIKDIPNSLLRHIILENNENRPVTYTRDTQEVGLRQGLEMLGIFKRYPEKTSLLDDFIFYENREKLLKKKRTNGVKNSNREDAREGIIGEQLVETNDLGASSLVSLTNDLSLDS